MELARVFKPLLEHPELQGVDFRPGVMIEMPSGYRVRPVMVEHPDGIDPGQINKLVNAAYEDAGFPVRGATGTKADNEELR